eukprot:1159004-Pelagomonas_calceolata.AAC.2
MVIWASYLVGETCSTPFCEVPGVEKMTACPLLMPVASRAVSERLESQARPKLRRCLFAWNTAKKHLTNNEENKAKSVY